MAAVIFLTLRKKFCHRLGFLICLVFSAIICLAFIYRTSSLTIVLEQFTFEQFIVSEQPRATKLTPRAAATIQLVDTTNVHAATKTPKNVQINSVQPYLSAYKLNNVSMCRGVVDVIICVHSSPANDQRRNAVRETWSSQTYWPQHRVRLMFFTGLVIGSNANINNSKNIQLKLEKEHKQFGDIVQSYFEDTYRNLTLKAIAVLHWIHAYCSHSIFYLKTDDDVIVNVFTMQEKLISVSGQLSDGQIACCRFQNITVKRTGKWAVTKEELNETVYPDFCAGMGYLMRTSTALSLRSVIAKEPLLWIDDIFITGYLARRINASFMQLNVSWSEKSTISSFSYKTWQAHTFGHVKNLVLFRKLWTRLAVLAKRKEILSKKMKEIK